MSSYLGDGGSSGGDPPGGDGPGSGVGPVGVLERLEAAVAELVAGDPVSMDGTDLAEWAVRLCGVKQRLEGGLAEVAAAFDASRVWAESGARSAGQFLAFHTRLPAKEVNGVVRLGRDLRLMFWVSASLNAGRMGVAHARRLARLARCERTAAAFCRDEELLVGFAESMLWPDFERAVAYWLQHADPDGVEDDAAEGEASRRVHLSEGLDGVGILDGQLTPVGHATLHSVLDDIDTELFKADWAEAEERLGRTPTVEELERTPAQRRHDALVEMAVRAATAPKDGQRPAPLVSVLVGWETLNGRVCELANEPRAVVTPGAVARLFDRNDGVSIERVVFDTQSRVIDISQQRRFTGGLRRAVQVRDRQCAWPGCTVPALDCDVDHVQPWSTGGPTSLDNGQPLCRFHNHHKGSGQPADEPGREPPQAA